MASTEYTYKMRKALPQTVLTVRIVETPEFKVRKWVATRLIMLAAWVLGCGIKVKG